RHRGEIRRAEADQLLAAARPVAGDAAYPGEVLAEAGVVVDDDCHRDVVAVRRFQFGQVIIKAAVAGEAEDLARPGGALRPERRGEGPAERAGGGLAALPGAVELARSAGPDACR